MVSFETPGIVKTSPGSPFQPSEYNCRESTSCIMRGGDVPEQEVIQKVYVVKSVLRSANEPSKFRRCSRRTKGGAEILKSEHFLIDVLFFSVGLLDYEFVMLFLISDTSPAVSGSPWEVEGPSSPLPRLRMTTIHRCSVVPGLPEKRGDCTALLLGRQPEMTSRLPSGRYSTGMPMIPAQKVHLLGKDHFWYWDREGNICFLRSLTIWFIGPAQRRGIHRQARVRGSVQPIVRRRVNARTSPGGRSLPRRHRPCTCVRPRPRRSRPLCALSAPLPSIRRLALPSRGVASVRRAPMPACKGLRVRSIFFPFKIRPLAVCSSPVRIGLTHQVL